MVGYNLGGDVKVSKWENPCSIETKDHLNVGKIAAIILLQVKKVDFFE